MWWVSLLLPLLLLCGCSPDAPQSTGPASSVPPADGGQNPHGEGTATELHCDFSTSHTVASLDPPGKLIENRMSYDGDYEVIITHPTLPQFAVRACRVTAILENGDVRHLYVFAQAQEATGVYDTARMLLDAWKVDPAKLDEWVASVRASSVFDEEFGAIQRDGEPDLSLVIRKGLGRYWLLQVDITW